MTLNKAQLVENYISQIVGEIEELYGEEFAQDLVESVSGFDS